MTFPEKHCRHPFVVCQSYRNQVGRRLLKDAERCVATACLTSAIIIRIKTQRILIF
jgi:hypothetical protein